MLQAVNLPGVPLSLITRIGKQLPTMALTGLARNSKWLDTASLSFVIDHVFLPPQLPQEDDTSVRHLVATVQILYDSVSGFLLAESSSSHSVQPALQMLERFLKTDHTPDHEPDHGSGPNGTDKKHVLRSMIADLKNGGA